jgi:hypothetical protein
MYFLVLKRIVEISKIIIFNFYIFYPLKWKNHIESFILCTDRLHRFVIQPGRPSRQKYQHHITQTKIPVHTIFFLFLEKDLQSQCIKQNPKSKKHSKSSIKLIYLIWQFLRDNCLHDGLGTNNSSPQKWWLDINPGISIFTNKRL